MEMDSGVYEIVNTVNGKRYVGSASDFHLRWKLHESLLNRGVHHSRHLQAAWVKHGAATFAFNKIILCSRANLLMYEQAAMDALSPEYNILKKAGSNLGAKRSAETRAKQSLSKMGNKHTLGYKHRPESIEKLRAKQMGVPSPTKGQTRSPDAVKATADAHRGMKRSPETCAKIAAKAMGRKRSPESIEKAAAKIRGVPLAPEVRAKLIGNQRAAGLKHTDEWKALASESMRAAWADPDRRAKMLAARCKGKKI